MTKYMITIIVSYSYGVCPMCRLVKDVIVFVFYVDKLRMLRCLYSQFEIRYTNLQNSRFSMSIH
jgi:hypothetical protein